MKYKIYTCFFALCLFTSICNAQDKTQLGEEELDGYEKTAQSKYDMYLNLITNMLNKKNAPQSRRDARILLDRLLDYNAKISEPDIENSSGFFSKQAFIDSLWNLSSRFPVVNKEVINKEKVIFKRGPTAKNEIENVTWNVYSGKMRACEISSYSKEISETIINPNNLNVSRNYRLKKVTFELRKPLGNESTPRRVTISKIETLEKRDNAEYIKCGKMDSAPVATKPKDKDNDGDNEFVDCDDNNPKINSRAGEIPNNGIDDDCDGEIDEACKKIDADGDGFPSEDYCRCEKDPALVCDCNDEESEIYPQRDEIPNNGIDDNCNNKIDENIAYTPPKILDYIIPGPGHMKYGKDYVRYPTTLIYFTGFIVSTSGAIYFKTEENKYYSRHLSATTLREKDFNYDIANDNHHKFLITAGAALTFFSVNAIHLKLKDAKQRKNLKSAGREDLIIGNDDTSYFQLKPSTETMGYSLLYNF